MQRWQSKLVHVSLSCLLVVMVGATGAGASTAASMAPPKPVALLLGPSDFAGKAKVIERDADAKAAYRVLGPGLRLGSVRLLAVYSAAAVLPSSTKAREWLTKLTRRGSLARTRKAELRAFATFLAGSKAKPKRVAAGPLTSAGIDAKQYMGSITFEGGTIRVGLATLRVDRAIGSVTLVGLSGGTLSRRDVTRAVALARERMRAAFTLDVTTMPYVTGLPFAGQVLLADAGTWTGGPSVFTYTWSRCDAAGSNCLDVPGATTPRYEVGAGDTGMSLRVTVVGRNSISTSTANSNATTIVTE